MPLPPEKKPQKESYDVGKTLPMPGKSRSYQPAVDERKAPPLQPPKQRRRLSWRRAVVGLLLAVLGIFIFIGAWDAINLSRATKASFGSGNLFSLLSPASLKGASNGRVNLLLVGYSVDDPGHSGANLTDSIVLLSLSTTGKSSYLLSIPRDLYTDIPGFGYARINEAYKDGGMSLLEQTVTNDFGMPINYYAIFDYTAVRDIVNALGGVDITVNSPDGRLYDPNKDWTAGGPLVDLSNGPHHLNGEQALDFSRARGDPSPYGTPIGFEKSDFQRTADQRQVITAAKGKVSWTLVLNPLKNGKIFQAFGKNVKTDISLHELRPLFSLFNGVPSAKLQSLGLNSLNGKNYLTGYVTDTGEDVEVPTSGIGDYGQIDAVLAQINQ